MPHPDRGAESRYGGEEFLIIRPARRACRRERSGYRRLFEQLLYMGKGRLLRVQVDIHFDGAGRYVAVKVEHYIEVNRDGSNGDLNLLKQSSIGSR